MKKRLTYLLLCLIASIGMITAQTTRITGKVISSEDNEPVIGASIVVKGTTIGTVTDYDGAFTLDVPSNAKTLVASYVGMEPSELAIRPNMNIILKTSSLALDEVVVTALGIKKSEKALGYAASTVKADDITAAQSGSVMGSLAGKVAGVNISGAGSTGVSQNVLIRGLSSLTGSNQPLYIIDGVPITNERSGGSTATTNTSADFGNSANDINPENVESVTILKGASATALYGSRAANGVIMITTKKADKEKLTVSYNGSFTASNVLRVMQTQDIFGQGWGAWSRDENGSWGPRLDGSMREWGSDKLETPMTKPFSYVKDNMRNFYQTGLEMNNGITVRYGTAKVGVVASFNNLSSDGILPNDGDKYSRNNFFLRGYANVDKFTLDASMEYNRKDINRAQAMDMELLQHAVDVDFSEMKDYNDVRYDTDNYYTFYANNPYWMIDNFRYLYQDDNIRGRVELGYEIIPGLKATGRLGGDFVTERTEDRQAKISYAEGSYSDLGGKNPEKGYYAEYSQSRSQIDALAFLSADYKVGDFSLGGTLGWNLNVRSRSYTGGVVDGLDIPGWYNLQNTTSAAVSNTYKSNRRLVGVLGTAEVGFRDYLFLNFSARNDWSSTLPKGKNSFFYGGANISFLLTELMPELKASQIDFLKIRAAVGQTGNDAGVYLTSGYFTPVYAHYTRLPIGGVSGLTEYNRLPSLDLKPEISTEYELGLTGNFFKNRIAIDVAYYNKQTKNQIISANLPPETGYTTETKNIGKIENKGVEMLIDVTPVRTKDWEWTVGWTFAKNWSKVKELWEGTEEYPLGYWTNYRGVEFMAIVGEPVGVYRVPAAATVEDKSSPYYGYTIVNNNGFITTSNTEKKILGNANPDFTMGFNTTLKYKDFSLRIVGDWRKGGYMYSSTAYISHFNGNSTQTVFNERNSYIIPNSVKMVNGEYVENNIPVLVQNMPYAQGNYSYNPEVREHMVIPKDYFKIRELVLSYRVPTSFLSKTPIAAASLSLIGRNLFLFTPKLNNYIDPEATNLGNEIGSMLGETTGTSSTRNFGVGINVTF
ncbi:TonB-linked SusC/RagA family outer membrane protein [Parabacteroides sp. PF5-5]|uniref:SusC/RagA family TonB-linked outer membrane protein n=1 Tax=unclassified Parabacteroides TaxID=2649774 RepID=UPI0024742DE6|nr:MULTISPECIES: SusC/RagA family TonB-linked outer membrane protein [unclassified Parabacteroides]MDH6304480.1 TonB-linked SusC/RagA family outer membrane protein [Parabacteroides sp. PH5-39]MDH6315367.1 TonB-linked SusC/RagA family outer membrane protein [Parabacteroides sp. PF5-13]MDH6319139.1 TonB-linked SusC/RagA family outer membrane protein [Parabacteroides sp. PH5-13]MDH6322869.1 TonB-linked SusC/RagA family outer membrane protein [Parabacteroides sp. PH5-8]MDH6326559.1 TonB-linked Sus